MITPDVTSARELYAFPAYPQIAEEELSKTEAPETKEPPEPTPRMIALPKPDFDINMVQSAQVQRNVDEDFVRTILDRSVVGSRYFLVELSKLPKGKGKEQLFADYLQKFGYILSAPFGKTEGESCLAAVLQSYEGILSLAELQGKVNAMKIEILQGIKNHWEELKLHYLESDCSLDCEAYCNMIEQGNLWNELLPWTVLLDLLRGEDGAKTIILNHFTSSLPIRDTYYLDEKGLLMPHTEQVLWYKLNGTGHEQLSINILSNPSSKNFQALISSKGIKQSCESEVKPNEGEPTISKEDLQASISLKRKRKESSKVRSGIVPTPSQASSSTGKKRKLETLAVTEVELNKPDATFKKPYEPSKYKGKENIS